MEDLELFPEEDIFKKGKESPECRKARAKFKAARAAYMKTEAYKRYKIALKEYNRVNKLLNCDQNPLLWQCVQKRRALERARQIAHSTPEYQALLKAREEYIHCDD